MFYTVLSPVRWNAQITLLFTPWQTCSFRHQLDSSEKHSSHAAITRESYSLTFPPPSIARYSFIHLSELGCRRENANAQTSKQEQRGDSNPGSLDCESGILPLSYRTLYEGQQSIGDSSPFNCIKPASSRASSMRG